MPRRPAAVLWDMDGTLVDTEPYWIAAETELVESYGHVWPEHHAHAIVGFDLLDAGAYIREHGPVPLTPPEIVERLLDGVIARLRARIPWRPGARELLAELQAAGIPCALVTMSWRRFVEPIVAALPAGSFQAIVTGDAVARGKPDPEPYLVAAHELGVAPAACVAIEDSPTGVRSALAAGCRVLGVPNVKSLEAGPGVTLAGSLREVGLDDLARLPGPARRRRPSRHQARRRRTAVLGGLTAIAAVAVGTAVALDGGGEGEAPPRAVPLDVWAPYWTLGDTLREADTRLPSIRELSPFWYGARGVTEIVVDENTSVARADAFLAAADESGAAIVPSIRDQMPAGGMAAVLADPATRSRHVTALVEFAGNGDFAGLDLDYEQFAFSDGRASWEATRPNWVAFVEELAAALHRDGRTLTVSIPPLYDEELTGDRGYWVYDHGTIAEHVDAIRIMAYDYSVPDPGPIAPLWWVGEAVAGTSRAVPEEHHHKLVLGIPAYGSNWVVSTSGECPASAEGRTTVTARTVAELAIRRGAIPRFDPVTDEWSFTYDLTVDDGTTSCVQSRTVHWVDAEGARSRIELARRARWGGVALWALGYEDDEVWRSVVAAIDEPLLDPPSAG